MEEIVLALNSIANTLGLIWLTLLMGLLFKDCNGGYRLREIESAIKDLVNALRNKN